MAKALDLILQRIFFFFFFFFFFNVQDCFICVQINYGLKKGEISITEKQGVLICIPKEGTSKSCLKN